MATNPDPLSVRDRLVHCKACSWTCRHAWMPGGQWQCGCCGHVLRLEIGTVPYERSDAKERSR